MADGVIYGDERLNGLTQDERLEYVREMSREGVRRRREALEPQAPGAAPALAPLLTPPGVPAAPSAAAPSAPLYTAEPHTMPDGRRVWVHPLSQAERIYVNRQVLREVRGVGLTREDLPLAEARIQAQEAAVEFEVRLQVWQTVVCCRTGPEWQSGKAYPPEQAGVFLSTPGWSEAVQEVAALSLSLVGGKGEAALLRELLTGFFGRMESWLMTCSSQLSTGEEGVTSCRESLDDFAASVSNLRRQGPLGAPALQGLAMVMGGSEGGA